MRKMSEEREEVIVGERRYRLSRTGYGSDRYGPCDICGKRADSVYYQREERLYWNPIFWRYSWTGEGCEDHMGHRECLEKIRRK